MDTNCNLYENYSSASICSYLKDKLKDTEYVENSIREYCVHIPEPSDSICSYIKTILLYPSFQKDPVTYLHSWSLSRWNTEEFRIPEDYALIFFEIYFAYSYLTWKSTKLFPNPSTLIILQEDNAILP